MKTNDNQPFIYTSKRINLSGCTAADRKAALIDIVGFWIWKLMLIFVPVIVTICLSSGSKKVENKRTTRIFNNIKKI